MHDEATKASSLAALASQLCKVPILQPSGQPPPARIQHLRPEPCALPWHWASCLAVSHCRRATSRYCKFPTRPPTCTMGCRQEPWPTDDSSILHLCPRSHLMKRASRPYQTITSVVIPCLRALAAQYAVRLHPWSQGWRAHGNAPQASAGRIHCVKPHQASQAWIQASLPWHPRAGCGGAGRGPPTPAGRLNSPSPGGGWTTSWSIKETNMECHRALPYLADKGARITEYSEQ